jgi:hypothetical protein
MPWKLFACLVVAIAVQTSERFVDLTRSTHAEPDRAVRGSGSPQRLDCYGRVKGRPGAEPTLSLTIARLDGQELSMGGRFVAEVAVRNTGSEPIDFPIVPAHEFGDGFAAGPYAVEASLGLRSVDADGREHSMGGAILRGSPSRPETIASLAPGDRLRLRFSAGMAIVDGPDAPVTGDAQLFARLQLSDNECRDWKSLSSRRVNVRLKGRN